MPQIVEPDRICDAGFFTCVSESLTEIGNGLASVLNDTISLSLGPHFLQFFEESIGYRNYPVFFGLSAIDKHLAFIEFHVFSFQGEQF